jgi:hypothetical protein
MFLVRVLAIVLAAMLAFGFLANGAKQNFEDARTLRAQALAQAENF